MIALFSKFPKQTHGMNISVDAIPNYHVVSWDTDEVLSSWEKLAVARRWAKGQGHTGEDHPGLTGYPPIAYVADNDGYLVYNPRFSKRISEATGGLINAQPPNHF